MSGSVGHRLDGLKARRILGGVSVQELAQRANLTDELVHRLESGDNCRPEITARILAALGGASITLTSNTQANPTVFTSATHTYQTGDTVVIAGVTGANADPNGTRIVTRLSATTFSVPIDCTLAGGTGGTATITSASIGQANL